MKKLLITIFSLMLSFSGLAQEKSVSGTVTSKSDGAPLPGVSIVVQGTTRGTQTDFDGKYTIIVSTGETLTFSFIGMKTTSVTVAESNTINLALEEDANSLDEVVVTALGIQKTRKSLTYSAQDIKADELSRVKQTNPINSLSGKVAGVTINRSASGLGGSVKVTLRGNNSLRGNQPLYVVDGIPLSNPTSGQPTDTFGDIGGGNRDGGDALSLLNPEDIESLTVLKGASASALYGSSGLNGVILITTKKGKSRSFKVTASTNLTIDSVLDDALVKFNDEAKANVDGFFDTGITNINSVSISGGTEKAQTHFSYTNGFSSGILPTNSVSQHTINFRETVKLFNDKLSVNGNVLASSQKIDNRPISGLYFNPLVGVYGFQSAGEQLSDYENFEEFNTDRLLNAQRWFRGTSDIEQNPYWILNRNAGEDTNKKLLASLHLNFKVNDWLSLQTRGTYDESQLGFERRIYATTEATLAPLNGRYIVNNFDVTQLYGDIMANINKSFNDDKISLTASVGAITSRTTSERFIGDSGTAGGLQFANVFSFQNFEGNPQVNFTQNSLDKRTNSLFASATIGFNDNIFIDVTGRNDWSSALPDNNNSYFYPSIGVTTILSDLFDMEGKVSFAKFRASYAEVGNDVPANTLFPSRNITFGGGGVAGLSNVRPLNPENVRPEQQKSFELGTEWKFFDNRLGIELGYYHTNTVDQYFNVAVSSGSGAVQRGVNSGDIVNSGFEGTLFAIPVQKEGFKWTTNVNFATNNNEIKQLSNPEEGVEIAFSILSPKGVNTFASYLVEGGSFGDLYAQVIKRDANGTPIFDNGALIINDDNPDNVINGLEKVGNANPDFTLGWNNSFEFKNFTVDFLVDGKFGGETVALTEAIVEGLSNNSARETANGTVDVVDLGGNASSIPAQQYYGLAGGRNGFSGEYVYSATNVRLAEFALGYNFNLSENSFFKKIKASLVGSNLFFFYKDAPHDPNISLSTGGALQGVDVLGLPSTRSIGLNVNLTF